VNLVSDTGGFALVASVDGPQRPARATTYRFGGLKRVFSDASYNASRPPTVPPQVVMAESTVVA